ncbi:MAG: PAS domain-containing protein [Anaerolineae bacterium]|nr:PAS domain-containing protein [Anaerolineae bacterium]
MDYTLFAVLAPLAAFFSVSAALYVRRFYPAAGARALSWAMLFISGWLFFNTLEILSPTAAGTLTFAKLTYTCFACAPVLWLVFAVQYTGRHKLLTVRRMACLWIIPIVTVALVYTNEWHGAVWARYSFTPVSVGTAMHVLARGVWYWVFFAYAYLLILFGTALIIAEYVQLPQPYRQQTLLLAVGASTPLILNFIYNLRLIPGMQKDFSPIAFAFTGLALALGVFRYRLFDLRPIAHNMLIESMTDALLVIDERNRIVDLNPAGQRLLGVSDSALVGQSIDRIAAYWPELAHSIQPAAATDVEITRYDRCYDLRIVTLRDSHQYTVGHLITLRDITERKHAETEREKLIAELNAFTRSAAHDLKNPLGTIKGFVNLIQDIMPDTINDEMRLYLDIIDQNTTKGINIIETLLLLASVRKNTHIPLQELDMSAIVAEVRERLAPMFRQYQAELVIPDCWPAALGYRLWVEEVWMNYISNALKYGGRPPHVELGADMLPNGTIRFWVKDNGSGIAPQDQPQLFKPFTRLSLAPVEGHGLGLSIVQSIVEKLGGEVGVESAVGQGSRFCFTLAGAAKLDAGNTSAPVVHRMTYTPERSSDSILTH